MSAISGEGRVAPVERRHRLGERTTPRRLVALPLPQRQLDAGRDGEQLIAPVLAVPGHGAGVHQRSIDEVGDADLERVSLEHMHD